MTRTGTHLHRRCSGQIEGLLTRSYVSGTYVTDMLTGRLNFRLTDDQERALRQAAAFLKERVLSTPRRP